MYMCFLKDSSSEKRMDATLIFLDRVNLLGGRSNLAIVDTLGKTERVEGLVKVVLART